MALLRNRQSLLQSRFAGLPANARIPGLVRWASGWSREPCLLAFRLQRKVPWCAAKEIRSRPVDTSSGEAGCCAVSTVMAAPIASRLLFVPRRRKAIEWPISFIELCRTRSCGALRFFRMTSSRPSWSRSASTKARLSSRKSRPSDARDLQKMCRHGCWRRNTFLRDRSTKSRIGSVR